jgi:putative oxygen-independent coproporphyrinogen III oxidase
VPPLTLPPLSLYLHFPWCVRKCPYCDFNSHTLHGELPQESYIDALLRDLTQQLPRIQGRALQSIFMGGGTPSLFMPAALSRLLDGVRALCGMSSDIEVTLEANPGTIERGRFEDYRAAGITRVSLGAQSFDPQQLQRLGRIHSAQDTQRAARELHAAGISQFNLDLMYGLPGQTQAAALQDLSTAVALQPTHLSHYQLTLEPGTVFAGRPPADMPDPDTAADMQLACQAYLANAGFAQYEVSAYARGDARCRHNLNYWQFGDYLGLGAGAHGKSTTLHEGRLIVERTQRARDPRRYLAELDRDTAGPGLKAVSETELPFEYFLNVLRLTDGFHPSAFEARTGLSFERVLPTLQSARSKGLMACDADHWRPTPQGLNFLNDLQSMFLAQLSDTVNQSCKTSSSTQSGSETDARVYTQPPTPVPTN